MFFTLHQPDFDTDELRGRLAANLRRLRVASRHSLSELARATQISKATLSVIERGQANPTIETLAALAGALGVSVSELLEEASGGEIRIVRFQGPDRSLDEQLGVREIERLRLDGQLDVRELSLPPRAVHRAPGKAGERVHLLVLSGRLIAGPCERISELSRGDWCSFPAEVEHLYEAGAQRARALLLTQTESAKI